MENERLETAIFAGGCFWGMEHMMRKFPGVKSVMPGYIGGHKDHPRYEEVKAHTTGHAEAVRVQFDPSVVSLRNWPAISLRFTIRHRPTVRVQTWVRSIVRRFSIPVRSRNRFLRNSLPF